MLNKDVIIIGGEGNGGVVASCIEDNRNKFNDLEWRVKGFLNDFETGEINGYPILGGTDTIENLLENPDYYFIYAIHMIGRNYKSKEVFDKISIPENRFATIIHKSSFIANNSEISAGVTIMSNCYIGPKAKIGLCSLVMANSMIGHNTSVGKLCHFSVGSITSSYVNIGDISDVTLGARVLEKRNIGNYAVAGAGSLVTKDIPEGEIHVGSPAKFLKYVKRD